MAPVTLSTVDSTSLTHPHSNSSNKTSRPQGCNPASLRNPIRRARLSRSRNPTRTRPEDVLPPLLLTHPYTSNPTDEQQKPHPRALHPLIPHPIPRPGRRHRTGKPQRPAHQHDRAAPRDHRLRRRGAQPGYLHARVCRTRPAWQSGSEGEEGSICGVSRCAGARDEECYA